MTITLLALFIVACAAFLAGFIQGAFTQRRYDRQRRNRLLRSLGE